ncbi:Histone_H2A [Hexamita inflata]|uniref:Histone H2A n=1 Tax=Hexamita inflata TaxID=28002 RepID=A0AA86N7L5_9EUKA|nr:Histone H2A [Hexamita inflata]CAI9914464.1 Histone H2A [Hexamita inflata]CAI9930481.1 Histone H2A [Hexamita inflata]
MTEAAPKHQNKTRSEKAGLLFPVGRIHRVLKSRALKCKTSDGKLRVGRVSGNAAIYLATVMEYLCNEVLDLAAESVKKTRTKRITPQIINTTIKNDDLLRSLFKDVSIANSSEVGVYNEKLLTLSAKDYFQHIRSGVKEQKQIAK